MSLNEVKIVTFCNNKLQSTILWATAMDRETASSALERLNFFFFFIMKRFKIPAKVYRIDSYSERFISSKWIV